MELFKKRKRKKLSKKELDSILPILKDFNGVAKHLIGVLGAKVQQKEQKINVLVHQIGTPIQEEHSVKVMNVDMNKDFLSKMKSRGKKAGDSEWDDNFSQKKGFVI